MFGLDSDSD